MSIQDALKDLVEHTHDLGVVDFIKINGTDKETQINAVASDRSVVIMGNYINPVAEFIGTIGMSNLGKLKILLGLEVYRENANLTVSRKKDTSVLDQLNFENKSGDFKNSYRFIDPQFFDDEQKKEVKFKTPNWNISFTPTIESIQRLKMQASANAEEVTFQARSEGNNLVFSFGDHSNHSGKFVFAGNVTGQLTNAANWPIKPIISILDLAGDKTFNISDAGAIQITVNSGTAIYNYILPSQRK